MDNFVVLKVARKKLWADKNPEIHKMETYLKSLAPKQEHISPIHLSKWL